MASAKVAIVSVICEATIAKAERDQRELKGKQLICGFRSRLDKIDFDENCGFVLTWVKLEASFGSASVRCWRNADELHKKTSKR